MPVRFRNVVQRTTKLLYANSPDLKMWLRQPVPKIYVYSTDHLPQMWSNTTKIAKCAEESLFQQQEQRKREEEEAAAILAGENNNNNNTAASPPKLSRNTITKTTSNTGSDDSNYCGWHPKLCDKDRETVHSKGNHYAATRHNYQTGTGRALSSVSLPDPRPLRSGSLYHSLPPGQSLHLLSFVLRRRNLLGQQQEPQEAAWLLCLRHGRYATESRTEPAALQFQHGQTACLDPGIRVEPYQECCSKAESAKEHYSDHGPVHVWKQRQFVQLLCGAVPVDSS